MGSSFMRRTAAAAAIVVIALAAVITLSGEQTAHSPQDSPSKLEPLLEATFDAAYNLDHTDAAKLARSAVALAPQDPRSHRALATVLWLELLFRQGALTLDFQLAGLARSQGARAAAPAALDSEIKQELARAAALSDASVRLAPASIDARYEYGAVNALEASYAAAAPQRRSVPRGARSTPTSGSSSGIRRMDPPPSPSAATGI